MAARHDACARRLLEVVPALMQEIRHGMRGGRGDGLSIPQFRTLALVAHQPGASLGEAAAHVGLGAPAMSVIVDGLVRRGLVGRCSCAGDRRRSSLTITPAGAEILERARVATRRMLAQRLARMSDADVAAIAGATGPLGSLAAEFPAPHSASAKGSPP